MDCQIHKTADVQSNKIGENSTVWQFCVIFKNAVIGSNCNICSHCLIENDVTIGDNVTIKSGVQIWDGITIMDNAFVGPNVTFTNDLLPRSKSKNWTLLKTTICQGASIGANATIIAGVMIGEKALIGAGSLVSKSVQPYTVWYGNPAKHMGYISENETILDLNLLDKNTGEKYILDGYKPVKK